MTKVESFDYALPEELIAATPAQSRGESRLLELDRCTGRVSLRLFSELPELLRQDDLLVLNDVRVMPARIHARRTTGGAVELLLVRPEDGADASGTRWLAIARSSGHVRQGEALRLDAVDAQVVLVEELGAGRWVVSLGEGEKALGDVWKAGRMPLPPYITRARRRQGLPAEMPDLDRERYQTVYARPPEPFDRRAGAVAAPTAGLHFTEELLERIARRGAEVRKLTLMIGPGTFQPVRTEDVEQHRLEAEYFELPGETAGAVQAALRAGRRVVATGTTTCRVLEYVARTERWEEQSGWTDLFIYPPFEFRAIGALITNFHLPRSTLLMLVCAFAGTENVLNAYRTAVEEWFRFYSYGDAMFIA